MAYLGMSIAALAAYSGFVGWPPQFAIPSVAILWTGWHIAYVGNHMMNAQGGAIGFLYRNVLINLIQSAVCYGIGFLIKSAIA